MAEINWKKRRRIQRSDVAESKILESECGHFRVRHTRYTVGPSQADVRKAKRAGDAATAAAMDKGRLRDAVYAQRLRWFGDRPCWVIVSRHRSVDAALSACGRGWVHLPGRFRLDPMYRNAGFFPEFKTCFQKRGPAPGPLLQGPRSPGVAVFYSAEKHASVASRSLAERCQKSEYPRQECIATSTRDQPLSITAGHCFTAFRIRQDNSTREDNRCQLNANRS